MAGSKAGGRKYALASALFFAVHGLVDFVIGFEYIQADPSLLVTAAIRTGMAAAVFLRNKKAVLAAAGANFLSILFFFQTNWDPQYFDWIMVLEMISYISLGVAVVCFGKGKGVFGKTWFLPGAFSLAAALLDPGLRCYLTEWPWYDILYFYSETAALIFAGFWLKNDPSLKPAGNDAGQEWSPYAIDRNVST